MQVKILAFAQARDQLGFSERLVDFQPEESPRELLARLAPGFATGTMRVAVDCEYFDWDTPLGAAAAEIALIPPVSGG